MNIFLKAHAERAGIEPGVAQAIRVRAKELRADVTHVEIAKQLEAEFPTIEFSLRDVGSWADGPLPVYTILARGGDGKRWMQVLGRSRMRRSLRVA